MQVCSLKPGGVQKQHVHECLRLLGLHLLLQLVEDPQSLDELPVFRQRLCRRFQVGVEAVDLELAAARLFLELLELVELLLRRVDAFHSQFGEDDGPKALKLGGGVCSERRNRTAASLLLRLRTKHHQIHQINVCFCHNVSFAERCLGTFKASFRYKGAVLPSEQRLFFQMSGKDLMQFVVGGTGLPLIVTNRWIPKSS